MSNGGMGDILLSMVVGFVADGDHSSSFPGVLKRETQVLSRTDEVETETRWLPTAEFLSSFITPFLDVKTSHSLLYVL